MRIILFDIAADPYQTRNLVDSDPDSAQHCDHLLNEWRQQQRNKRPGPDPLDLVLQERRKKS